MNMPKTTGQWARQVGLAAVIAVLAGYFYPEKRAVLLVLLGALAMVSWGIMRLSARQSAAGETEERDP